MKKKKLPLMHFACSDDKLRPAMSHIEITKSHTAASDGRILVAHNTKDIFSNEFIEVMPEKFYLHKNIWRDLAKPHISVYYDLEKQMVVQVLDGYKMYYCPIIDFQWKYPKWESVIPKIEDKKAIDTIGLSLDVTDNFKKAFFMPNELKQAVFTFFGANNGVLVNHKNDYEGFGIIMPCMV